MINETIVLLTPLEDCSNHRLAKHMDFLRLTTSFDLYFYKPLQKIFSKVIVYDYVKRQTEIGVKGINEEVIELVRKEHPKYILWISAYYEFRESTFEKIRKEGTKVIGWFSDDEVRFDYYSRWWVPYLDYCVTNNAETVPKYKKLGGIRVLYGIPCTGIAVPRDLSNLKEKYTVSFVGRKFLDREQNINELRKRNISVHVVGRGWGNYISHEEMIDIFRTSKINLNFSRIGNTTQIKGRVFEICLVGGFLLTEYVPGIEKFFEINREIVCFQNAEEMIEKIIYYLSHDEDRRSIAQAGWKRATSEYTSFHILARVFNEIEEDIAAKGKINNFQSQKLKMPMQMRKNFSDYYLNWGKALSLENYNGLWKDTLALSISYNPFNTRAWYHYIIGFLPYHMRFTIIRLFSVMQKLRAVLTNRLLCWADSVPFLRRIKRSFKKRFYQI